MKNKERSIKISNIFDTLFPSLSSIVVGIVLGGILLLISVPENALPGFLSIIRGPFTNTPTKDFGNMLYYAAPIMLTGLSVGFAFKTGLFNIGASGQFFSGAFAAIAVGVKLEAVPVEYRWIVSLVVAFFVGAAIAGIGGLLKAQWNVNEVISSIMLNYISLYVVLYLVKSWDLFNALKNETVTVPTMVPKMGLDKFFKGSFVGGSIFIAIVVAIIVYFVIEKTTFGYELKAVGHNRDAARYAGINEKRSIILSMFIAGGLAGLSGAITYLVGTGKHIPMQHIVPTEGFDGIAVALLANNHPIGIIFTAIFIGYLKISSQTLQTLGYVPEVISMVVSIILYTSALSVLFIRLKSKFRRNKITIEEEEIS